MKKLFVCCIVSLCVLLCGCAEPDLSCPTHEPADMPVASMYASDDSLPFQFPLVDEDLFNPATPFMTVFAKPSIVTDMSDLKYHAAEDYAAPPGTPVYAMADGKVSFSGTMGGYGWLVIVDHPQVNLYSLYGHLSPSRWYIEPGPVKKGELLGYLGDDYENGGSKENPLIPHLHFGIRAGQKRNYPTKNEWRWMAGWIKFCPQDLGWLQPSTVIISQAIPDDGYVVPKEKFLTKWGVELLFTAIYLVGSGAMLFDATRKDKPVIIVIGGVVITAAGLYFLGAGWKMGTMLLVLGPAILLFGIYRLVQRRRQA